MKQWKIVRRPLLETVLKSYSSRPIVLQALILHGPRGVGKRTLIEGLVKKWQRTPHAVTFLDLGLEHRAGNIWNLPSWTPVGTMQQGDQRVALQTIRLQIESGLEDLTKMAAQLGCMGSYDVFKMLRHDHAIDGALLQFLKQDAKVSEARLSRLRNTNDLWQEALQYISENNTLENLYKGSNILTCDWDSECLVRSQVVAAWHSALKTQSDTSFGDDKAYSAGCKQGLEELRSYKETLLSLVLARLLLRIQEEWRKPAGTYCRQTGAISKSWADSITSWPLLLISLLSRAVIKNYFQPKLVMDNIDVLRKASADESTIDGLTYHDSFLLRIIRNGFSEGCIPIILVTSDSYYSFQIYEDFGYPSLFVSREVFGWTPQEASVHLVPHMFSEDEWRVVTGVLGSNPRHLLELQTFRQRLASDSLFLQEGGTIEDCIDIYLGYLQVTVVDPALETAVRILEKFAENAWNGKIVKWNIFRHGAPWRHPPKSAEKGKRHHWARIQLMDFIEAMAAAEFGVNYLGESGVEILEDPSAAALLEVGMLYQQRDPSYIRPTSRGIMRCLIRWLVKEKLQWSPLVRLHYYWQRLVRGRSYRHLMVE